ncbi:MAG: hypothetical protein HOL02_01955 [Rhodospirillaceae bacterium]|nr:hypothetical protein [Rhodospirillaceae bacterium]
MFDPARHLALEAPAKIWSLADFGYDDSVIAATPSPVAAAGPFRLMSNEGVSAVQAVCRALRDERCTEEGQRTSSYVAGAVYRSRFLRDLTNSPDVAAFLSDVAGTELAPHSLPSQQVYINFAPDDFSKAIDNWHIDSIGFDYVLMASDPTTFQGGKFQFFRGTLDHAASLLDTTPGLLTEGFLEELPQDLVETIDFPGAGYALFQQGHLVLHRASRLETQGERITLVPGFVTADVSKADPTKVERMAGWGEPGLLAELARHVAWRSRSKLELLAEDLPLNNDRTAIVAELKKATADIERLVTRLERDD